MNRWSVVVVDDLAELRQILRLVLEHGGPFKVVGEGGDGEEAVALAAEHHPDLLLMDVEMPGGPSGWDVLPRLREVAPETLVVILSGSRADRHPDERSSLVAAVLEKGLPPKELNAALLGVLGADPTAAVAPSNEVAPIDDALVSAAATIENERRGPGRSSGELEAFAAVAGHDLAQPLQVAYGYLEMLRSDYGDALDPTAAAWLDAAVGSLDRMRVLVQAVVGFARAGARPPEPTSVELAEVVDAAVAQLPAELTERGWQLRRGPLPVVRADAGHLEVVLRELLDNALRFAPREREPRVELTVEEREDEWVVIVADDGPGVPPTIAGRAFEAFARGASGTGRGAGLGLATSRKLVEAHGGRIWLESAAPGDGATFRFSLPRP